jgi:hypothetical protein
MHSFRLVPASEGPRREFKITLGLEPGSGDMGFELCYLPDMPAVLRALAGAENSIERWWQQLEAAKKAPGGFRQGD